MKLTGLTIAENSWAVAYSKMVYWFLGGQIVLRHLDLVDQLLTLQENQDLISMYQEMQLTNPQPCWINGQMMLG